MKPGVYFHPVTLHMIETITCHQTNIICDERFLKMPTVIFRFNLYCDYIYLGKV